MLRIAPYTLGGVDSRAARFGTGLRRGTPEAGAGERRFGKLTAALLLPPENVAAGAGEAVYCLGRGTVFGVGVVGAGWDRKAGSMDS